MSFPESPGASTCGYREKEERMSRQDCGLGPQTPLLAPGGEDLNEATSRKIALLLRAFTCQLQPLGEDLGCLGAASS